MHGGFRRLECIGRATCMQASNEPIAFMNAYLVVVALYLVYVFRFTVTEDIRTQAIWYHATATFAMSFYIRQWRFVLITRHMLGGATNQPIDTSVSNSCGFQCVALFLLLDDVRLTVPSRLWHLIPCHRHARFVVQYSAVNTCVGYDATCTWCWNISLISCIRIDMCFTFYSLMTCERWITMKLNKDYP